MKIIRTPVDGVTVVEPEWADDERGSAARIFCAEEFAAAGLDPVIAQCSLSFSLRAGTLRGLHYRSESDRESKLVRCTRGAIVDVAVDLRPGSPSYLRWHAVECTEENGRALFIPPGCAHGFQTLRDDTEIFFHTSVPFEPGAMRGVRWDDPAFSISWPEPPPGGRSLSERDAAYADYVP